jgi:hypothetical protein
MPFAVGTQGHPDEVLSHDGARLIAHDLQALTPRLAEALLASARRDYAAIGALAKQFLAATRQARGGMRTIHWFYWAPSPGPPP